MPRHVGFLVETALLRRKTVPSAAGLAAKARPFAMVRSLHRVTICHLLSINRSLDPRAFYREAEPTAAQGLQVRMLAPHGIQGWNRGVELVPFPRRHGRLLRWLLVPTLIAKALRQRASIYHFHDPELIPVGLVLKILFRKKVIYDAREDYPAMVLSKSYLPKFSRALLAGALSQLEAIAAFTLDGIITADPLTLRRLARAGPSKKLVFYNFPNLEFFPAIAASEFKSFDLVYRGGLSARAGAFLLLDAIRALVNDGKSLSVLLLGYFDDERSKELLEEKIRQLGVEHNVRVAGRISHDQMARVLSQARIGICPLQATRKFQHNIPVKVFEYWACGLPVVASDLAPIRPFFRDNQLGLLFKAGDVQSLCEAIRWLLDHPAEAAQMGIRGRCAMVGRYNNSREVCKLLSFYQRILEN
jgi:glycosyltransferase involved in cell wall biosynthesis